MTTSNPADRLDSWKEIAVYLRRDVRTVQRWEKSEGLPVHRHRHDRLSSVYAYKSELTAWFDARQQSAGAADNASGVKAGKIKLAVLAFGSLGVHAEEDYFSQGLCEELITQITRVQPVGLSVIAQATALEFDAGPQCLERMQKELGVGYVLEGKVRRSGARVRITTQLVRLRDHAQLWAETYDRDLRDVLDVQAGIAHAIAQKIGVVLKLRGNLHLSTAQQPAGRVEPAAYDAYLKARYSMHQMTPAAIRRSIEEFERAVELDPGYAPAHAGLASACALVASAPFDVIAPHEAMPRAEKAARRALEIDESLAEAHTALALVQHHYHWNWKEAELCYRRALELNPGHAATRLWYSWLLLALGRRQAAVDEIERTMHIVQETDPRRLVAVHATRAAAFYFGRDFRQAADECGKALQLDSGHFMLHYILGRSLMRLGDHAKAIAHFESAKTSGADMPLMDAALGLAYAVTGHFDKARRLAEKFKAAAGNRYIPPTYVGMLYAGLGNRDEALRWLEKAYEERADGLTWLNVDPMLDDLRSDPGFQNLIQRIGL
jgi:TolB-like protein/Tfp pilus assembly protein PilF